MDKEKNLYIVVYAAIITIVVAVSLAFVQSGLKDKQVANELADMQNKILKAVNISKDSVGDLTAYFDQNLQGIVLDNAGSEISGVNPLLVDLQKENKKSTTDPSRQLPLYIHNGTDGLKQYIIPLWGAGLWDYINGFVAVEDDFNTIYGAAFDHKQETPGLGAEIKDNPDFRKQFVGKKLYDGEEFVSIEVKKGFIKDPEHQVQAVSGATVTSNGVTDMFLADIADYMPYFEKLKNN